MIMLTKEQLADLLREAFKRGAVRGQEYGWSREDWLGSESFYHERELHIQPLVNRSSGGHDDHGREVK